MAPDSSSPKSQNRANPLYERNLGLISEGQQNRLLESRVLICGVGGMRGVCAEVLVRLGIGNLVLVDHDKFDLYNFNRQIHANRETLGRNKAEVLAEEFRKINPDLKGTPVPKGLTDGNVDEMIVQSTIGLAHNLGIKVVAEGVENLETWDRLSSMGCDYLQGYYISKPLRANQFVDWLDRSPWTISENGSSAGQSGRA